MRKNIKICAIIVSYHPTHEIIENVDALVNQVDEVVIVDNGSGSATKQLLDNLIKQHSKINVVFLQENLGIAAALNIGVKKAKAAGYEWLITFDQDSQVTPLMIDTMLQAYDEYPKKEKVASLSPKYKDKNTGRIFGSLLTSSRHDELSYAESQQVITSGNLVKLSVFDTVGYFNEALFIDYVDYEYCLRCITQEYKIIEVKSAVLIHSLGSSTQHKLLWKRPLAFHHSPLRRYYIARNAIYTYKRFFFKHPVWIIKNAYGLAKNVILIMLFENDRKKKLNATFKGVIDGVLGQMGKCRSPI